MRPAEWRTHWSALGRRPCESPQLPPASTLGLTPHHLPVQIKNIVFSGGRTKCVFALPFSPGPGVADSPKPIRISVNDNAKPIYILCGANTCENFDFTKLTATGGRNATVVPEALKTQIKGLKL